MESKDKLRMEIEAKLMKNQSDMDFLLDLSSKEGVKPEFYRRDDGRPLIQAIHDERMILEDVLKQLDEIPSITPIGEK